MIATQLPNENEMYRALCERDTRYDGIFFFGVKTTGIFCRPSCSAKKPKQKNVSFYPSTKDALSAGFRACKKCRPLEAAAKMPSWLVEFIKCVDENPMKRWTDTDLRESGVEPARARRWFKHHHGITFHGYLRARRLASALSQLSIGENPTIVAHRAGYESLSGFRDAFQKWFGTTPGQAESATRLLTINRIPTILGPMVAAADGETLYLLEFADRRMLETQIQRLMKRMNCRFLPGDNSILETSANQVGEYFAGTRTRFSIPFASPGTEFQRAVWNALMQIPYGETTSYERLADRIGARSAQRAVGRANGDNRLAIVIPCHRVIRSDGTLGGYGGGVRRKEWFLQHEQTHANPIMIPSISRD